MVDLHKEIKLSDLFRRSEKPEKEPKPEKERRRMRRERLPNERDGASSNGAGLPPIPLMRAFDLLPRDGDRDQGSRLPHVPVALGAVLAVAAFAAFFLFTSAGLADRKARHDELRAELAGLQVPAQEPAEAGTPALAQEQQTRTAALSGALGARVAWDRLLRELSLVLPDDVTLTTLTASVPGAPPAGAAVDPNAPPATGFSIAGFTDEQGGVALLLSRLSVLPELSSVRLVSANAVPASEGAPERIQFTITAGIRQGTS